MAINPNLSDAPSKALQMLTRVRKLHGTALINAGVLIHDNCPRGSNSRELSQSVIKLFEGLEQKNEYADNILVRFDGIDVLLMYRPPVILCLFFHRDKDLASIEKGGIQFLNQFSSALGISGTRPKRKKIESPPPNPAPAPVIPAKVLAIPAASTNELAIVTPNQTNDEDTWIEFRRKVEILFTKVLGSAQASRLLTRELEAMGVAKAGFLRQTQFRPFGQKLTQKIKDKAIRNQIENELISMIDDLI